jgi:hypothetical protein
MHDDSILSLISGFRREVDENYPLLSYYEASSGNFLQTFRDILSVPSAGIKNRGYGFGCSLGLLDP